MLYKNLHLFLVRLARLQTSDSEKIMKKMQIRTVNSKKK